MNQVLEVMNKVNKNLIGVGKNLIKK